MPDRYECDRCGACCRQLIIEIQHIDVVREPRLIGVAQLMDGNGAIKYGSEYDKDYSLACGATAPCPFLGADNLCGIYPTRPNVCVGCDAGGDECQQARGMAGLPPLVATEVPR